MKYKYETGENVKRSKNFEKRKKFIMELLGDPLYKPCACVRSHLFFSWIRVRKRSF